MPSLDAAVLRRHRRRNQVHSALLLTALAAWLGLVGWLVMGPGGILGAALLTLLLAAVQPVGSLAMLLRVMGALPLTAAQAPGLFSLTGELAGLADLPQPPRLWFLPRNQPMALSVVWGDDSAIAVSAGLLANLPPHELAGVLAHEISHLRAGDVKLLRLAATTSWLIRLLSLIGLWLLVLWPGDIPLLAPLLLLVLAPLASDLLILGLSRTREFAADAGATALTGDPQGLMAALERLEAMSGVRWARLFGHHTPRWLTLVLTHPTTAERVARLAEMTPSPHLAWPWLDGVLVMPDLLTGRHIGRRSPWNRPQR